MHFGLTDEQQALATTVRDFLRDRFDLESVRKVFESADQDPAGDGHPRDLWTAFGEHGWLAITVPEEHEGLGLGLLDAQVVARALGAGVVPGPWLPTVVAAEAVRLAGSAEQQARWLPKVAVGEAVGSVALSSPVGIVDGTASGRLLVEYAHVADVLVVVGEDGSLGLVDPAGPGARASQVEQYDLTTRVAEVTLDGAPVDLLPGGSPQVLADSRRRGAVLAAADLVGVAREALTRTVAYDRERVQFGRPVGSFQALKHALADLHVGVTMAEHAVLYAAHAIDAGLPDAALAASVAKSKASATAKDATAAMIQYHGGIGFTWEHDAHFFYKRAKRLAAAYGDAAQHREEIAALVLDAAG